MSANPRWIYEPSKQSRSVRLNPNKPSKMTNGKKIIFVESMYTDRKLGLLKKGIKKRHILDTTK